MSQIQYAARTHPGQVRSTNEDRWFADAKRGLFIVADGMGGQFAGDVAAQIVVDALPRMLDEQKAFDPRAALRELSDLVRTGSQDEPAMAGMGATVVLALVGEKETVIAHMGDSRAYRWRPAHLEQLTRDHSMVQLLIESGDITEEEALTHPARAHVTRFVGMSGEALPEVRSIDFHAGDRLLLCTDGLTNMLSHADIVRVLDAETSIQAACDKLIERANAAGGKDNITAIVIAWADAAATTAGPAKTPTSRSRGLPRK